MSIAFEVDDVVPAREGLPLTSLQAVMDGTLRSERGQRYGPSTQLAQAGPDSLVERYESTHPLVNAVHLAFASHYPLTLTPDALWTTIAQGFALHISLNAEALRGQFVEHQGKLALVAFGRDSASPDEWSRLVAEWCAQIRAHVGSGTADLFLNSFSTSGPVERTVSEIVMMDAFERYFAYRLFCICGIPRIELTGTVDDWQDIRRRIELMEAYGLDDWVARLRDICDQLVESACGRPDRDFWQCMYKPREVYEGTVVNGWLSRLFPYLETETGFQRNHACTAPPSEQDLSSVPSWGVPSGALQTVTAADRKLSRLRWLSASVDASSFPNGLSRVPVTLRWMDRPETMDLELIGGLVGVVQHAGALALQPSLGWVVRTLPPHEHLHHSGRDATEAMLAERKPGRLGQNEH